MVTGVLGGKWAWTIRLELVAWNWQWVGIVLNRAPTVLGRLAIFTFRQLRTILSFQMALSTPGRFKVDGFCL
jgi:hypothetical protein